MYANYVDTSHDRFGGDAIPSKLQTQPEEYASLGRLLLFFPPAFCLSESAVYSDDAMISDCNVGFANIRNEASYSMYGIF